MDTEKLFSKLGFSDYNNQLEKILENKDFSVDVKNLLLSMLYKIETAYKDYANVKRIVENKKTYIEEVLRIVRDKCKKIAVVDETSNEAKELEEANSKFLVNKLSGTIFLMYPNEALLLYTLYKLDDKQVYLDEKYNLIRNALSELLNAGENINNIEVLRDFNGWNWNTQVREIPEITTNLIYQNLIYLLGIDFIKEWVHTEKVVDYIELVEKKLSELYGEENTKEVLKQIYKISIVVCVQKSEMERKRLTEEKEILENELNRLKDKKTLLNEVATIKKDALKRIKEIDNILNDKKMLEEEYVKRNERRPMYNKIFNITHLTEILNKERKKQLQIIEENNKLLEPKQYIKTISNLESQLELLQDIDLNESEQEESKLKNMIDLQKTFIKCFNMKIDSAKEKDEIINLIYMTRYYTNIYLNSSETIKDIKGLKKEIVQLEKKLIEKAYELKVLNLITEEESTNNEIIKNILNTKIIMIENISIELKQNEQSLEVNIYDGDIYEKTIVIPVFDKKKIIMKFNKTYKIFN